jgi:hypothetical protein
MAGFIGLRIGYRSGFCERDNEPSSFVIGRGLLARLRACFADRVVEEQK